MTLERGSSRDELVNGANQRTDMSLIHRRCNARVASNQIDLVIHERNAT